MINNEEKFLDKSEKLGGISRELSVYGKEKFVPEKSKQHVEELVGSFKEHFNSLGYIEEPSVPISSGVDSSVRFIGSPISVLKPYLGEKTIPNPGVFMRQDCIRTKNLNKMLDDDFSPNWGSYFPNMGAITPPERTSEGCSEAFDFFEKKLGISPKDILIRINSADKDLMDICQGRYKKENLEIDSKPIDYYRHKLGVEGLLGRNCNIALRNANGEGFSDVANLIMIENGESKVCLEISIGTTTILKELHGLDHVQDGTPVSGLDNVDAKFRRKFEDAIVTSAVLFREGLRPLGQHNRNRILKRYVQAMSYFRARCNVNAEDLKKVILEFEGREFFDDDKRVADVLIDFMLAFENELLNKNNLTVDQEKIKQALLLK